MAADKITVAVLFGGRSGEHPVSCTSAAGVLAHMDRELFDPVAIGITRAGAWRRLDPDAVPTIVGDTLPEVTDGTVATVRTDVVSPVITLPEGQDALAVDVVFPLLHGPYGEDGTLQGLLELADVPYVGPGVLASAVAMDKEFTKTVLAAAGLSVAPAVVLRRGEREVGAPDRARLKLPVFVKPARAGSSLGVSRIDDWADLPAAIAAAREHDVKVLVEAAVTGREVECGVLEFPDGRVESSALAEIQLTGGRFYDFDAKYLEDVADFALPADLPAEVTRRVRTAAVTAFRAIDAAGLARVDFFVQDDGAVIVNEINTMPGFTPISMYPQMWAATGVDYRELITTLIHTALARGTGLR